MGKWEINLKKPLVSMFWWNSKPSKELYPILKRNKIFLVFIKWIVEKLKLSSKCTQAYREERSYAK
jgi:hypothetical protein